VLVYVFSKSETNKTLSEETVSTPVTKILALSSFIAAYMGDVGLNN